jgi:hypothetical protein
MCRADPLGHLYNCEINFLLDYRAHSAQGGLGARAGRQIPLRPWLAMPPSSSKESPWLSSSGFTASMCNVRLQRYQSRICGHQNPDAGTIHTEHQAAADKLVLGLLSNWPGQKRNVLLGTQPPLWRQLRNSLAAAKQDSAINDWAWGDIPTWYGERSK